MTNKVDAGSLLSHASKLGTVTCVNANKYIYRGIKINIRDMGDQTAIYTSDRSSYRLPRNTADLIAMFNGILDEIDSRNQKSALLERLFDKAEAMLRAAGDLASFPTRAGRRNIAFNGRRGVLMAKSTGASTQIVAHMPLEMSIRELAHS